MKAPIVFLITSASLTFAYLSGEHLFVYLVSIGFTLIIAKSLKGNHP